jgi:hypothetical protein
MGRFEINSRKPSIFEVAINRVVNQTLRVELISPAAYHPLKSTWAVRRTENGLRSIAPHRHSMCRLGKMALRQCQDTRVV